VSEKRGVVERGRVASGVLGGTGASAGRVREAKLVGERGVCFKIARTSAPSARGTHGVPETGARDTGGGTVGTEASAALGVPPGS
jgi:hypothetical protein